MQQKIFELKLSTHATSLYLLLAALAGQDLRLDRSLALDFWNASEAELDDALYGTVRARGAGRKRRGLADSARDQMGLSPTTC